MLLANSAMGQKTVKGNISTDFVDLGPRGWTAFHVACFTKDYKVASRLLEEGVEVDMKDEEGRTALIYAVISDHNDTIKFLLTHGANPYITDVYNKSALDYIAGDEEQVVENQTQVV